MAWQLLAILVLAIGGVTWFVRDERRRASERAIARAAQFYAHAPQYRHVWAPLPDPKPRLRATGFGKRQPSPLRRLASK